MINILIEPEIVGDIKWADATYNSIHGEISSSWKKEENIFTLKVKIPVSCTAIVVIPQADPGMITENDIPVTDSDGCRGYKLIRWKNNVQNIIRGISF